VWLTVELPVADHVADGEPFVEVEGEAEGNHQACCGFPGAKEAKTEGMFMEGGLGEKEKAALGTTTERAVEKGALCPQEFPAETERSPGLLPVRTTILSVPAPETIVYP